MNETGIMLYTKSFIEEIYDENLLAGFFASITNFGREALGSVIKNIDLGGDNKLILIALSEERLLGAAIMSSKDNIELSSTIIRNIMQDFIDNYSPDYDPEKIFHEDMEKIIQKNLSGKILRSPYLRLLISWIIVGPLSYLLVLASIYATTFLYELLNLEKYLGSLQLFFTRFLPGLVALSAIDIIILFLGPNLILGYLAPNWKIGFLGSILHMILTILLFFNSIEPIFAYIVVGYLPLAVIFSFFFLFVGTRLSAKKFLKKK